MSQFKQQLHAKVQEANWTASWTLASLAARAALLLAADELTREADALSAKLPDLGEDNRTLHFGGRYQAAERLRELAKELE